MKNVKSRDKFIVEGIGDMNADDEHVIGWRDHGASKDAYKNRLIPMSEAKKIAWEAWKERDTQITESEGGDFDYKSSKADFNIWWEGKYKTNENVLPRPCPKTKCLECGEEVCDSINFKVGHLYNKHNCKPSVGDYKAKNMMKKYFA